MVAAVTRNGSEVACSSAAATVADRPSDRLYSNAGTPRTNSSAMRNTGTRSNADGSTISPRRSSATPLDTKKTGTKNP